MHSRHARPSNGELLAAQAALIRRCVGDEPCYSHVVSTIRRATVNLCPYSLPVDRHVAVFEQYSPVGSSRVVAGASDVDEHVQRAIAVDAMPRRDLWSLVQTDLAGAVRTIAAHSQAPEVLLRKRAVMEGIVKWAGKALTPLNERMRGLAPEQVARLPTTINVALVAALCDAVGWPDTLLPAKLLFGSPTTGDLPSSHVMRPKERRATTDPCVFDVDGWADSLHVSVEQRGRRMSAKARATAAALLAKSIDEAAPDAAGRSWSTGPLSRERLREYFPHGYWPSRRFGVPQKGVLRPCDDNRENHLNDSVDAHEAIAPDTADTGDGGIFVLRAAGRGRGPVRRLR